MYSARSARCGRSLSLQFGCHARVARRSPTSKRESPGVASRPFAWDLALRRGRLIWQVFGEQLREEGVRGRYGNGVVGEAGGGGIAGGEGGGGPGVEERKEVGNGGGGWTGPAD